MSNKESAVMRSSHAHHLSVHLLEQRRSTNNTFIYSRVFVVCVFSFKGTDKK